VTENEATIAKLELEVENLKRQNEKLAFEVEELRAEGPKAKLLRRTLPFLTGLITVIAIPVSVFKYVDEQQAARAAKAATEKAEASAQTKAANDRVIELKREAAKPFWDRQLALYLDAAESAAVIATTADEAKRKLATERFWVLYWGPLAAVEDVSSTQLPLPEVEAAMVRFGRLIGGTPPKSRDELSRAALELAHAIRREVGPTFEVELSRDNPKAEETKTGAPR
jgi:hypothetical protein